MPSKHIREQYEDQKKPHICTDKSGTYRTFGVLVNQLCSSM